MANYRGMQPSFTAGEMSPSLAARVDLSKYASGVKTALNLIIHAHGGVSNRAGFEFVREVAVSADSARVIPFQFNTEQSYILEFGDEYFRIFRDGGVILSGVAPYEVVTPYAHGDLDRLVFVQEADVMYIVHPEYAPRKLSRLAEDDWTLSVATFTPSISPPATVKAGASFKYRSGSNARYRFSITAVSADGAESAASTASNYVRFQWENDDGRFMKVKWDAVPDAASYNIYRSGEDNNGFVGTTYDNTIEFPSGAVNGDGATIPTASATGAPAIPANAVTSVNFGTKVYYKVAAVSEDTGEESLPSDEVSVTNDMSYKGNKNTVSWSAVSGASAYIVYKKDNGLYGYIGRTEADTLTFVDENVTADLSDGPQEGRNPFDAAGKYPRCVTFIEQRLAFASTKNEPQAVWLSQSANYENFGVSTPAKASDAVTFRIRSRQVNEIRSMLAIRGLMLLTSGSEWLISGGGNSDAITPSAIKSDNQGYRGAARVQPIVVGNTVLFAQRLGGVVRDFSYQFTEDSFAGKDLTILSRHLFDEREIVSWAYAQAPHSIAWVVLDDGTLVSLTYMKEHDVWGWTRHDSGADAYFEDVTVISEGQEDVPYFIVRRTIDGVQRRYIERLHTRTFERVEDAFFVDCGLTYSGAATKVIEGLGHLEGQGVVALADGNVVHGLTVQDGSVTLPVAASKVHVGLPMVAALQTLDLDLGQVTGLGSVQGRMKSVPEVTLRVERTRGIFTGPYDDVREGKHLVEYKQRQNEAWSEAIGLYTGDIRITPQWDWNTNGSMWVKQFDPLPMTILAIMPDVTIGR